MVSIDERICCNYHSEDISVSDFHDYFSTFSNSSSDHNLHNYACTNTHIYELDKPITENKVEKVISNMSRGKSSGLDDLINEMFIDSRDILSPYLARILLIIVCILQNGLKVKLCLYLRKVICQM